MTLKETLIKKFGSIYNAAKQLGYSNNSRLFHNIKTNNPRLDTIIRFSEKGINVTVKNGKVKWFL